MSGRTLMKKARLRRAPGLAGWLALLFLPAVLAGCGRREAASPPGGNTDAAARNASAVSARSTQVLARRQKGKKLYLAECSGCHGERGRGDGPAAPAVSVKPRDFVGEKFKYRSTASGSAPRREDILTTIARGMPGTAMPSFAFLPEEDRQLIADYILYLARLDGSPEPEALTVGKEPPADQGSLSRGRAAYQKLQCAKCHGDGGRGDGPSAKQLVDAKGRPIVARDLTTGIFRRGQTAAEIVHTFASGIDGTPMPSYSGAATEEEMWDLAHYVQSLRVAPPPMPGDLLARGRWVVEQKQCFACHVIEGRGGRVGPSLDVSARKLRYAWVKDFLPNPRAVGKIYMFTPYRMPDLGLKPEEIEGVLTLFARVAGRSYPEAPEPPVSIASADVSKGQLVYVLKCAECHNLGNVIPTPLAKQQGPDLINIAKRLRYDWIPEWVKNPMAVYPGTQMVDTNLNDEEIREIRAFLWQTSTQYLEPLSQK